MAVKSLKQLKNNSQNTTIRIRKLKADLKLQESVLKKIQRDIEAAKKREEAAKVLAAKAKAVAAAKAKAKSKTKSKAKTKSRAKKR